MKKAFVLTTGILTVSIILVAGIIFKTSAAGNVTYLNGKKQDIIWSIAKADLSYARNVAARISIPRLNKNMIVLSTPPKRGENQDYPFWVSGTDFPGTKGISLITGQSDGSLSFLRLLKDGDVISLETTEGRTVRFAVSALVTTEEKTVKVDNAEGRKILMMAAQYRFTNWQTDGSMMLVIIAREIKDIV